MSLHNAYFKDIILRHGKSVLPSRSQADVSANLGKFRFAVPVVAANMPSILTYGICKQFDDNNWFYVYPRSYRPSEVAQFVQDAQGSFNVVSISIGVTQEWLDLLKFIKVMNLRVDFITVDVALAYSDIILPAVRYIKDNFKNTFLIVGNTANGESISWFEAIGVDCVKVNIGISRSCRTKEYTGFSCTTVGNLVECAANVKDIILMSDGGLTVDNDGDVWIGDIAKAIKFGADWVMSGALFAGCIDTPSFSTGYYGNSTEQAKGHNRHVEGSLVNVKRDRTVLDVMRLVEDSLKSSVSYAGGIDLSSLDLVDYIDLR